MKLLTNLIFEPKGVHDPARTYSIKDTVMSPDGSKVYFALRDVPSGIALTDEYYWMLQIDLSSSKNAMDEAVAAFSDYAKIVGTRVKGETAKATGNPATFLPDAGSLLQPVTVLEPQQAGSGDPYPAGGGRNLIPFPYMTDDKTENGVTFTVQDDGGIKVKGTATGVAYFNLCEVHFSDINMSTAGTFTDGNVCISGAAGGVNIGYSAGNSKTYLFTPSSGAIDTVVYPQVEKGSTPTEYQKHSNIRPFIGYDKLDLNHAGKNLIDTRGLIERTDKGVTFTPVYDDLGRLLYINANGTATNGSAYYYCTSEQGYKSVLPVGETVTISGTDAMTGLGHVDLQSADYDTVNVADYGSGRTVVLSYDGPYGIYITILKGNTVNNVKIRPQIELGSTATPYEPYQGTLHTVQFDHTVYGGKYDWLTGKLVAEWGFKEFDGSESFDMSETGVVLYTPSQKPLRGSSGIGSHHSRVKCGNSLNIRDALNATDLDTWTAFVTAQKAAGTPVQAAWKLATPIEIQLTPHIISAVDPEQTNALYGDGSIEVEYVKPLHVSIEERVAAALAAATE